MCRRIQNDVIGETNQRDMMTDLYCMTQVVTIGHGVVGLAAHSSVTVHVRDAARDARVRPDSLEVQCLQLPNIGALIAVPMYGDIAESSIVGVLQVRRCLVIFAEWMDFVQESTAAL